MESSGIYIVFLAFALLMIISGWKMFVKAGMPGWGIIVPIYNLYLYCKLAGKPAWWIILCFIPVVNIVPAFVLPIGISQKFGQGIGFGIGMIFLPFIFVPILGFGSAQYSN